MREFETRSLTAAASGTLAPAYETFPLSRAADAHEALENRRTAGKVLLIP
ncbi:zinc-binding dehydrogenase [Nonomuraea sp. NPDC046570]